MAMNMAGTIELPADRASVWAALNDPDVLKRCIPGCQGLERSAEGGFAAVAKLSVGPVKATFKGFVRLSDIDEPNGYTISGDGQGGIAGFAKGSARVRLAEAPEGGGTVLSYDVEAYPGGKIAQLGSRLLNSVAARYAGEFFAKLAREFDTAEVEEPTVAA